MVLGFLPPTLVIILLSILPVSELRGAIFAGINVFGMPIITVFTIAVLANLIVAPLGFFFLDYVHHHMMRLPFYSKIFGRFVERTKRKAHSHIKKYGYFGLTIFVAIPLPVTGAYTATLAAWLFDMDKKKSILAISLGVVLAGIIVTLASLIGGGIWNIFVNSRFVELLY